MTVTFYARNLLVTFAFLVMFGATLGMAVGVRDGVAAACVLAVLAYFLIEVVGTVNPAAWWRLSRHDSRNHTPGHKYASRT